MAVAVVMQNDDGLGRGWVLFAMVQVQLGLEVTVCDGRRRQGWLLWDALGRRSA